MSDLLSELPQLCESHNDTNMELHYLNVLSGNLMHTLTFVTQVEKQQESIIRGRDIVILFCYKFVTRFIFYILKTYLKALLKVI